MAKSKKEIEVKKKEFMKDKNKLVKKGMPVKKAVAKANKMIRKKGAC